MRIRSEVVRRKKILISNPDLQNMNDTQWFFELESIYHSEEKKYDDIMELFKLFKRSLITILGLNIMPIKENLGSDEFGEPIIRLRQANQDEFLPLSLYCGRQELLSEVVKQLEELESQDSIDKELETDSGMTLEEFESKFGDLSVPEFFENPKDMMDHMYKQNPLLRSMVKPLGNMDDELLGVSNEPVKIGSYKKKSKVVIE